MCESTFPKVVEISENKDRASYERKCLIHEKLLYRYLERKLEGWSIVDFLKAEKIEKYILYAMSDFTILFCEDLKENGMPYGVELICDKNAEKFNYRYKDKKVIIPDELHELYKRKKVNKIFVMSILHEKEIVDELIKKGILLNDIISFVSVLFS